MWSYTHLISIILDLRLLKGPSTSLKLEILRSFDVQTQIENWNKRKILNMCD